ncbi:DNA-processing protein DprA [Actinomadura rubrisoli]|uniref:DNA-protecting protein DprA n=1 Tax=Actinomadura rubrisoli TaxID=2530368 RepID=A0A4R5AS33_9ACTN|nr:DNA-processing protein DprA [Actinomadura rubrisoli]TDD73222.1 DNA-protecting protein DprA [Actinomadura rubrisoli]
MNSEQTARAALTAVAEPGDALLNRIIDHSSPEETLKAIRTGRIPADLPITPQEFKRLDRWRIRLATTAPDQDLAVCAQFGGRLICPGEPEWPTTLDDLGDHRPYALWLRGPGDLRYGCLRSVAIVGSRAASPYGLRAAAEFASDLADQGWTVISGGALGIDAAAHRGALAAEGSTVAVLANGVDVAYPASNDGLFAEMARRSLLVSESPPGTAPHRLRFLVRNRVIAALSRGALIVEAEARSGALNTATWARKLGRVVMAVPGPITSRSSVGCHKLLREEGTILTTRPEAQPNSAPLRLPPTEGPSKSKEMPKEPHHTTPTTSTTRNPDGPNRVRPTSTRALAPAPRSTTPQSEAKNQAPQSQDQQEPRQTDTRCPPRPDPQRPPTLRQQGVDHQISAHVLGHRATHQPPGCRCHHGGPEHPPTANRQIGHIPAPALSARTYGDITAQQIGHRRDERGGHRGTPTPTPVRVPVPVRAPVPA